MDSTRLQAAELPLPSPVKSLLVRPLLLIALVFGGVLVISTAALVALSLRSIGRLDEVRTHMAFTRESQEVTIGLERALIARPPAGADPSVGVEVLLRRLDGLATVGPPSSASTPELLRRARALLEQPASDDPRLTLLAVLPLLHELTFTELATQGELVERAQRQNRLELEVVGLSLLALFFLAAILMVALRRTLLRPLGDLRRLLAELGSGAYGRIATAGSDPLIVPLLDNYNQLVGRLEALEEAQRARTETLENEVRAASRTLLEQQRALADAERLSAVGELAAGVAHELRNPLAGVQMALANLRRESPHAEAAGRIGLVGRELDRMRRLIDELLSRARGPAEPPHPVALGELVRELLALLRYQAPPGVELVSRVDAGLTAVLPEDRFRQALLNLVLNSLQALGEGPGSIVVLVTGRDAALEVVVRDDGPGLPEDILAGGGRPFRSGRLGGTGLGLAMVKRFASDLGGRLELANGNPRGALVTLLLPVEHRHE